MSEILKESKTKVEYSAEQPYTDTKKPKVKVVTQETDLTVKGDNEVETKHKTTKSINPIKFIEEHYPGTANEFKKIQQEQYEVFCKKQMDYGPSNISMGTSLTTDKEKRLSMVGLIVRINDKVQRLLNLVVTNDREAQNEPVIDAFKDLSVYGIIAQVVKNGKWGK